MKGLFIICAFSSAYSVAQAQGTMQDPPQVTMMVVGSPTTHRLNTFGVEIGLDAQLAFNSMASILSLDYPDSDMSVGGDVAPKPCSPVAVQPEEPFEISAAIRTYCFQGVALRLKAKSGLYIEASLQFVEHPETHRSVVSRAGIRMRIVNQNMIFEQAIAKYGSPDREKRDLNYFQCVQWGDPAGIHLNLCRQNGRVDGEIAISLSDPSLEERAEGVYNALMGRSSAPKLR